MNSAFALSEHPTVELIALAKNGDEAAVEAIFQRAVPPVLRWAHGRVPPTLRSQMNTEDLVQLAVMRAIPRLPHFEARNVGAMQAYLRQSVINEIRTQLRKVRREEVTRQPGRTCRIERRLTAGTGDQQRDVRTLPHRAGDPETNRSRTRACQG